MCSIVIISLQFLWSSFSSNNVVIKMSENTVYQSNRFPIVSQFNSSYVTTEDIHLYEEIPGGKLAPCIHENRM